MKKVSLGVPLAIGMVGTVASLFIKNKTVHTVFGIAWTVASLAHMLQYKKVLQKDVKKGFTKMNLFKAIGIPTNKMEWFLEFVEVGSYLPGRIRVYSNKLVNNPSLKQQVEETMAKYKELDKVTINLLSGSVLIEYDPEKIKSNEELCSMEEFLRKKAKK